MFQTLELGFRRKADFQLLLSSRPFLQITDSFKLTFTPKLIELINLLNWFFQDYIWLILRFIRIVDTLFHLIRSIRHTWLGTSIWANWSVPKRPWRKPESVNILYQAFYIFLLSQFNSLRSIPFFLLLTERPSFLRDMVSLRLFLLMRCPSPVSIQQFRDLIKLLYWLLGIVNSLWRIFNGFLMLF